jgi:NAD(P) transhydrogenase subunit alpha
MNVIKYLTIGVPKEIFPSEKRVSLVPNTVSKLLNLGFDVVIETGAGEDAGYSDFEYSSIGAKIVHYKEVYEKADILIKIRPPQIDNKRNTHEINMYNNIKFLICYVYPRTNPDLITRLNKHKQMIVIACDCVPRYRTN